MNDKVKQLKQINLPNWRLIVGVVVALWLGSGIYIVEPDEVGVVQRFGAFDRITEPGPHYRLPFPIESVKTPQVTKIQRLEIGFRGSTAFTVSTGAQLRLVPEESLMLTGDENIVDVQFIVQYQIENAREYLFNVSNPEKTIKDAAEAAMREVIGFSKIDSALTAGKLSIQNDTMALLQRIVNSYQCGIKIIAVQLQDVHPPKQVVDAFKDVASAKEDKSRFINEAEAYENDLIPKTRGEVAAITNQAQADKESRIRSAMGESSKFLAVLQEYRKAQDITKKRIYLETMEEVLSNPGVNKIILSSESMQKVLPYLPIDRGHQGTVGKGQGGAK